MLNTEKGGLFTGDCRLILPELSAQGMKGVASENGK